MKTSYIKNKMPYTGVNDRRLPEYVKNRSEPIRKRWVELYNAAFKKHGKDRAIVIANTWLKKQVKSARSGFVKRSAIMFDVCNDGFISRSKEGDDYITLVLNTTKTHRDGVTFTEDMLKEWADQINKNPVVGDIDHLFYNKILKTSLSDDYVKEVLKKKQGIAKTVRAIYDKGKLWVKAIIDKRYKKLIQKARGVSSEAFITWDGDKPNNGEILGFTFNINTTPAEYGTGVLA